jgi:hypothetical protein
MLLRLFASVLLTALVAAESVPQGAHSDDAGTISCTSAFMGVNESISVDNGNITYYG